MNQTTIKVGFWSASVCTAMFLLFSLFFIVIYATQPLFFWSNVNDLAAYVRTNDPLYANLARLCMVIFGPAFVLLLHCLLEYAPAGKKLFAKISLSFGLLFVAMFTLHYFVQLTAVRLSLQQGELAGLEQVIQANPLSLVSAINMLGVTLYFGLSSLFLCPLFTSGRLEKMIRYAFLMNGICCLVGGVSYALQLNLLLFVTINLGMGLAVTMVGGGLMLLFWRLGK